MSRVLAAVLALASVLPVGVEARGHGGVSGARTAVYSVRSEITTHEIEVDAVEVLGSPGARRVRLSQVWRDEHGRRWHIEIAKTGSKWVARFVPVKVTP